MGKAPEGCLNSPEHDRDFRECFLYPVRVNYHCPVWAKPCPAPGGVCVLFPRFQPRGQVAYHGIHVSRTYGKKEPWFAQFFEILRAFPAGLGNNPYSESRVFKHPAYYCGSKTRMVHIGVPGDQYYVKFLPAPHFCLFQAHGEEF